jgi:predicted transcriptional regulator
MCPTQNEEGTMLKTPMEKIKRLRKALGLTQWDMAFRVGRSQTWVSLRERGFVNPTRKELAAMSYVLEQRRREMQDIELDPVPGQKEVRNAR